MYTILRIMEFSNTHSKTFFHLPHCKHLFLVTILALLCDSVFAQLGTKFEDCKDVLHVDRPQISERQIAINCLLNYKVLRCLYPPININLSIIGIIIQ